MYRIHFCCLQLDVITVTFILSRSSLHLYLGTGINAWRVNGNNLHLTFTSCPDYEQSTPTTIVSSLSDWPDSVHSYHNSAIMELVRGSFRLLSGFLRFECNFHYVIMLLCLFKSIIAVPVFMFYFFE